MAPRHEWTDLFPDFRYPGKWQYVLHEWIGGIVYSLAGYGKEEKKINDWRLTIND